MGVDRDWEQERHRRRILAMNTMGDINRQERRWQIIGICAVVVLLAAIVLT
jgi:hypothetical protein